MTGRTFSSVELEEVAATLFSAAGTPRPVARQVSGLLVKSERMGHPSHGMLRISEYLDRIAAGRLVPDARCVVVSESTASVMIDGGWGFGQVAAALATERAMEKAIRNGIAAAGAYHLNHVGRVGDFTEMAAESGLIALAFVGGTPTGQMGNVAPFGGREAVWGTNPLAIAIPGEERVFSLDFATSVIAGGKAAAARARATELDAEYLIDRHGQPTSDPQALLDGGAIRPFGDHKGYGLAFAVELLAGALIGAAAPDLEAGAMHNGFLVIVLDPGTLTDAEQHRAAVDSVFRRVKDTRPAEGFDEVMIPGELEEQRESEAEASGISLPAALIDELVGLGRKLGVTIGL